MKYVIGLVMLFVMSSIVLSANPEITEWTINPCISSTWQNGTELEIRVKVVDTDGDQVSVRAILWYGNATEEQDRGWKAFAGSGTEFLFDTSNWTISKFADQEQIKLYAKSNAGGDIFDTINMSFSVGETGVEYGDCYSNDLPTAETNVTTGDDALTSAVDSLKDESAGTLFSGMSSAVIWIFIMIFFSAVIWFTCGESKASGLTLGVLGIFNFIMLIIGVYMNFISWIPIAIIVTIAVFIFGGVFLKKIFGG